MGIYNPGSFPNQYSPGLPSYSTINGYFPGVTGISTYGSGTPVTSAKAFFGFFAPSMNATISALALYLFTGQSGAGARLGVYSNVNGLPGNLMADFGTVDLSGSAGILEANATTLAISPSQGGLWICTWMKNATTQATLAGCGAAPAVYPLSVAQIAAANNARGYSGVATYPASLPAIPPTIGLEINGGNVMPLPWVKIQ